MEYGSTIDPYPISGRVNLNGSLLARASFNPNEYPF